MSETSEFFARNQLHRLCGCDRGPIGQVSGTSPALFVGKTGIERLWRDIANDERPFPTQLIDFNAVDSAGITASDACIVVDPSVRVNLAWPSHDVRFNVFFEVRSRQLSLQVDAVWVALGDTQPRRDWKAEHQQAALAKLIGRQSVKWGTGNPSIASAEAPRFRVSAAERQQQSDQYQL